MRNRPVLLHYLLLAATALTGQTDPARVAARAWAELPARLARVELPDIPDRDFSVTDFGAVSDTTVDSRPAVLAAMDAAERAGGGRIIVPAGHTLLLQGPLPLRPRQNLHLEEGSRLKFSDDPTHYLPVVEVRWEGTRAYNYSPLIYARGAHDIALTGRGAIDGNGRRWSTDWRKRQKADQQRLREMGAGGVPLSERTFGPGHYLRPGLVQLYDCRRVLIQGLTLRDSPFWTVHLPYSEDVTCRNLRIYGRVLNDDGIDPDGSRDVLIENCYIETHDDAISIKAGRDRDGREGPPSRNIIVRNCTLNSGVNAFAIGSELSGGVEEVYVENVRLLRGQRGLTIKTNNDRGGYVRRIFLRNITADSLSDALLNIRTAYKGYRGGAFATDIDSLYLQNIVAARTGVHAIRLEGQEVNPIGTVYAENVRARSEREASYTEFATLLRRDPAPALTGAIRDGADYAADVLLASLGKSRCDYDWVSGQWRPYEEAWHTGQVIYGLLHAYRHTGEERYLAAARRAGDWWKSLAIGAEQPALAGYLRAEHAGPVGAVINFTTIADGTPGLFELSRVTGDDSYARTAVKAADWALDHLYLEEEGLIIDLVDSETGEILRDRSPFFEGELTVDQIARPNNEGFLYYDAYHFTGRERYREVFLRLCNSLVKKQSANGFWMDYHPNHPGDGKIHPRSNTWYAESLLRGYALTGDERYRDAALRTARALVGLQQKNGIIYYRNYADGRYTRASMCGSALSFAGLLWLELYGQGYPEFAGPIAEARDWVLTNRFPTNHPDPNVRGAFLETRRYERASGVVVNVRDIATAFGLRFLTELAGSELGKTTAP